MNLEAALRLIAGVVVTTSVLLSAFVSPYFCIVTLVAGLNLFQSAFSNWCPVVPVLRKIGVR